jgi:hypothetical protein
MKREPMIEGWPGGMSRFRFGLGEFQGLQQALDSGPNRVLLRLVTSDWRIDDVIETIRFGLIGGGEKPERARGLAVNALDDWSPYRLALLAARVLENFLMQDPHDPAGEAGQAAKADDDEFGRWPFSQFIGVGAAMGYSPDQVNAMTLWQFRAAFEGWKAANSTEPAKGPDLSTEDAEALARDLGLEGMTDGQ